MATQASAPASNRAELATAEYSTDASGRVGRRGAARAAWAFAALTLVAGCGVESVLPNDYSELPEGADVEAAEWPLLVDNPATLAPDEAQARITRGEEINADLEARAAALRTEADLLLAAPGSTRDLAARAAAARAAGAALAADE